MIDHDTEGEVQSCTDRNPLGATAPSDVAGYGRVSDSVRYQGGAHASPPPDLERPLETFESSPIGDYLRRQRILRDVSIDELSALTRIPLRSLERLERGEFDGESDGFVRGFVRTVAEALGLDADHTVARILKEPSVGVWERHASNRRLKQIAVSLALLVMLGLSFLIAQAGWNVLVGTNENDPARQIVLWKDPVRSLAEATGAEVDPAGEIDPAVGSRRLGQGATVLRMPDSSQRSTSSQRTPPSRRRPTPSEPDMGETDAGLQM